MYVQERPDPYHIYNLAIWSTTLPVSIYIWAVFAQNLHDRIVLGNTHGHLIIAPNFTRMLPLFPSSPFFLPRCCEPARLSPARGTREEIKSIFAMEKHTNAPDKTNPSAETNQQNSSRSAAIPQAREEIIPPPKMTGDALSPAPVSPSPARYKLTIAFLCALLGFTFFVYASSSPASGLVLMTALLFGWLGMVIVVAVVADRQPGVTCQGGGGGRGGCLRREARELADGDAGRWDMERFHGGKSSSAFFLSLQSHPLPSPFPLFSPLHPASSLLPIPKRLITSPLPLTAQKLNRHAHPHPLRLRLGHPPVRRRRRTPGRRRPRAGRRVRAPARGPVLDVLRGADLRSGV
ncbi:hypothetical protein F4810DRAFT_431375 [Camillea tinctor]|nr:hypothetical protein F4810DRAFT_431375 [Camillea tinctor]